MNIAPPTEMTGANAGLDIPTYELNAAARFRLTKEFDIAFIWDQGLEKGATPLAKDQPNPDGDVYGGGVSLHYSIRTRDPRFRIGLVGELVLYSIPYVEYRTLVDPAFPGQTMTSIVNRDRGVVAVFNTGAIPSFRINDNLTVYASANIRNHPNTPRASTEGYYDSGDVHAGPINVIVSTGVEFALDNGVRAMLYVYQPVIGGPVTYGPTIGAGLTIPLSRDPAPPPAP